jgi:hypothetical protein
MTASIVSSALLTNRKAIPVTKNDRVAEPNRVSKIVGMLEVATTSIDEVGDKIMLFSLRGNDRLISLVLYNDALDAHATPTLAVDVGVFKNLNAAGTSATTVDQDALASAISTLRAANTSGVDVAHEAQGIDVIGLKVSVIAVGDDDDSNDERVIGLTVTTEAATPAAGTIKFVAEIVKG